MPAYRTNSGISRVCFLRHFCLYAIGGIALQFGISDADIRFHMNVVGKNGNSTLPVTESPGKKIYILFDLEQNKLLQIYAMEVCVDNIQSAINADKGGADRIELCSSLNDGGLTPSLGFFKMVNQLVKIPVYVMLRPRRGMDFVYSKEEIQSMKYDAREFANAGAEGFVFGFLNEDGTVNAKACREIRDIVNSRSCTFHRAFDCLTNPADSLNDIIDLGFERILTSGRKQSAVEGCDYIQQLVEKAGNRIAIVPASGVNETNVTFILSKTGATQIHGSFRTVVKRNFNQNADVSMGAMDYDNDILVADVQSVRVAVELLNSHLKSRPVAEFQTAE